MNAVISRALGEPVTADTAAEQPRHARAGLGMGVDRMIMMSTGRDTRETVLFPIVRPGP